MLNGATALALPTKFGQSLCVKTTNKSGIFWKSFDEQGKVWAAYAFKVDSDTIVFDFEKAAIEFSQEDEISKKLLEILKTAKILNPKFLEDTNGCTVETELDFPRNWGLGTSSTLINNIAQWANVDAFELLRLSFGGSGYDIAAAKSNFPILYSIENEKPKFRKAHLPWEFTENLFFIYLNQKQDSKEGIARFRMTTLSETLKQRISDISYKLLMCYDLRDFEKLLESHEQIISEIIGLPTVKSRLFMDYANTIKSLGAWGGDFVLATGTKSDMEYFRDKGYETIIPYADMIL